ncbi:Sec-independent protein translocase TatB [Leifsonia sp. NPDC056824]|uniref:Sec-independent protein translocase TatB n=1 Tax=Leifsonia sp. NPDC056824 TaxID=3345953 RepID=UPI0036901719
MLDLSFDKILVLLLIAAFLIGPKRLPVLAAQLARFASRLRELGGVARERAAEELGPEFAEVEWRTLDPRQYDPRRIIRDALLEPPVRVETEEEVAARLEAFGPPPSLEPLLAPVPAHIPKETHAAGDRPDSDR